MKRMKSTKTNRETRESDRSLRLDKAPLDYAPTNELGVVFLFAALARKKYGLRIEEIKPGFPDCTAYLGKKKVRIEFEYKSRNFKSQGHNPRQCDWIVCWVHNWPDCPSHITVKELCKLYGHGFKVWIVPVAGEFAGILAGSRIQDGWSVPPAASKDDLILYYRSRPDACISDIFRITGSVEKRKADWKKGTELRRTTDWFARIRRVASLKSPLHLKDLKKNASLADAGFIRGSFQGRYNVTSYWPDLHQMILDRNPSAKKDLKGFGPDRIT
jgi:hypothetical protein